MKKISFKSLTFLALIVFLGSFTFYLSELPTKPEDISPLLIGESIPQVKLNTMENKSVSLNELVSQKPTVLIFYRGGWCPYCNKQLSGIREVEESLKKLGYQIIALSPDKSEDLKNTMDKNQLSYTLLSDSKMEVSKAFGLAYVQTNEKYKELLEKSSGETHHLLPVPAVFVLNKEGRIKFEYINPDYKERLHPKLLLLAAELALTN